MLLCYIRKPCSVASIVEYSPITLKKKKPYRFFTWEKRESKKIGEYTTPVNSAEVESQIDSTFEIEEEFDWTKFKSMAILNMLVAHCSVMMQR